MFCVFVYFLIPANFWNLETCSLISTICFPGATPAGFEANPLMIPSFTTFLVSLASKDYQQLKMIFSTYLNSNIVIDVDNKHQEFISTMIVDVGSMNPPEKDLVNSQDQNVLQDLLKKITDHLEKYLMTTIYLMYIMV